MNLDSKPQLLRTSEHCHFPCSQKIQHSPFSSSSHMCTDLSTEYSLHRTVHSLRAGTMSVFLKNLPPAPGPAPGITWFCFFLLTVMLCVPTAPSSKSFTPEKASTNSSQVPLNSPPDTRRRTHRKIAPNSAWLAIGSATDSANYCQMGSSAWPSATKVTAIQPRQDASSTCPEVMAE